MFFPWILIVAVIMQVVTSVTIVPREKEQVVKLGETALMLCQAGMPIENCQIDMPSGRSLTLRPGKEGNGFKYYGDGLEKGHCGLEVVRVTDENNGVYICTLTPNGFLDNQKANMTLIVAKAPKRPELSVNVGSIGSTLYKEGDTLIASCVVRQGRPAANITWFIGEERITDGLQMPEVVEYNPAGLSSVQQNLTRRLQASDNGKELKCVAEHPLLAQNGMNTSVQQLNILFGPKPQPEFEHFGLVEGEEGHVTVSVPANPKPSFTWYINNDAFYEGDDDPTRKYHVLQSHLDREKPGYWNSELVIRSLVKEDVEQTYRVEAQNKYGKQDYRVVISTNPEPKVLDLGAGTIFAIVLGILIVLILTSTLVFARAKGRWCFSGTVREGETGEPEKAPPASATTDSGDDGAPNVASESSDTESAAERSSGVSKKPTFKLTFKKAPSKPADPQQAPMTDTQANQEEPKRDDEGVVYAELDLQNSAPGARTRLVRPEDDKTEYAEILHSGKGN